MSSVPCDRRTTTWQAQRAAPSLVPFPAVCLFFSFSFPFSAAAGIYEMASTHPERIEAWDFGISLDVGPWTLGAFHHSSFKINSL